MNDDRCKNILQIIYSVSQEIIYSPKVFLSLFFKHWWFLSYILRAYLKFKFITNYKTLFNYSYILNIRYKLLKKYFINNA